MQDSIKIIKLIGKGNFSKVYLIQNLLDQEYYALKILKISKNNRNFVHCKNEIQNLCKLDNPYIVKYIFSWYSEYDQFNIIKNHKNYNFIYILMEYCEYNLEDYIKDRNLILKNKILESKKLDKCQIIDILKFIKQLCFALEYIHRNNLIHRDIKPSNIFLKKISNNDFIIKLGDFGISKNINEVLYKSLDFKNKKHYFLKNKNTLVKVKSEIFGKKLKHTYFFDKIKNNKEFTSNIGTLLYMSPEQKNNNHYDTRSDLYSLGITLFLILYPVKTNFEKIIEIKNLKEKKINIKLHKSYPNISDLFQNLINIDHNRPNINVIQNTFEKDILNIVFNDLYIDGYIKILIKFENQEKYKKYFWLLDQKHLFIKKSLKLKYFKSFLLKDYIIKLEYNCIRLYSKKYENVDMKLRNIKVTTLLYKLINNNK